MPTKYLSYTESNIHQSHVLGLRPHLHVVQALCECLPCLGGRVGGQLVSELGAQGVDVCLQLVLAVSGLRLDAILEGQLRFLLVIHLHPGNMDIRRRGVAWKVAARLCGVRFESGILRLERRKDVRKGVVWLES